MKKVKFLLLLACITMFHLNNSYANDFILQSVSVRGTVVDVTGAPMPGVNIVVSGTTQGVITDADGRFEIQAPSRSSVLLFSFIGYISVHETVGNRTNIAVIMQEDTQELEGVVVVGYGVQRKSDLTGAIVNVNAEKMKGVATPNLTTALTGRLAGVNIQQTGGGPSPGVKILIRGMGTLNNNDPLVIVDDVIGADINLLNANDIESMTVMKDASAAAIYGSRAAGGVIVVKTKRGADMQGKARINFGAYYGWETVSKTLDVLTASQLATIYNEASNNDGSTPFPEFSNPSSMTDITDWQDQVFRTAHVQNYNLGISTGGPTSNLNISMDVQKNEGILINTFNDRYTFRVNSDVKIGKRFEIGETLALSYNNSKGANTRSDNSGIMMMTLGMHPDVPVYDSEGNYHGVLTSNYGDLENPVGALERNYGHMHNYKLEANAYVKLNIIDGLSAKTSGSLLLWGADQKEFYPIKPEAGRPSSRNGLYHYRGLSHTWIMENTINFDKTFSQHRISAVAGYTLEQWQNNPLSASKDDFDFEGEDFWYISAGNTMAGMEGGFEETAMMSALFRANYAYADKYLLGFNMRADGSSKFAKGNRWGYFPSVSAGWRMTQEAFMQDVGWLSDLKIRGSYGNLGNNFIDSYMTYSLYYTGRYEGRYNFGSGGNILAQGNYAGIMPNPDLKWETATQANIGVDAVFLNNSLSVTADYFYKKTKDILTYPAMLGYYGTTGAQRINGATVVNKGLEATIGYTSDRHRDFTYDLTLNFTTYTNEVTSLGNSSTSIYGPKFRDAFTISKTDVGYPMSYFYGYKTDGLFRSDADVQSYKNSNGQLYQPDAQAGDLRFVDINRDGVIDSEDRTKIGDAVPDFTYGLNASFQYKNFDLSMFFQGVQGIDIWYGLRYQLGFVGLKYNYLAEVWDRFNSGNTNTDVPRVSWIDTNNNKRPSDYYVEDGSYLRMKSLMLGYTLPSCLTSKMSIQQLRLYVAAQNLFTITSYPGYDPELGLESGSNIQEINVDRGQYPHSRTFSVGFNLSF